MPAQQPVSIAGLIRAWHEDTGRPIYWLSHWGRICEKMLWELEADDLQFYADALKGMGLAPWTVRKYVTQARLVWRWGRKKGWISVDPPARVKTKKPPKIGRDIIVSKAFEAIRKLNTRAKAITEFILSVGCRPKEARLLKWCEVDIERGVCVLGRSKTLDATGERRTIYLTKRGEQIVAAQPKTDSEYIFLTLRGKPYTKDGLHSVLERVGLNNSYALRHTFAQWFLDHGGDNGGPGDRAELSRLLGHTDGRMVDTYAQVRDWRLRKRASGLSGPTG